MSSSIFHKDLLVVPPEATFGPDAHSDDFILAHRLKKIFPENQSTVSENNTIRFHIYGAGQHLDTRSVRLFFTAQMNTTVPYTKGEDEYKNEANRKRNTRLAVLPIRFHDWIGSLFRTVEIRLNNQTLISRIDYRNILHHIQALYIVNQAWRSSIQGQNEGYLNSLAYRNVKGELVPTNAFQKAQLSLRPIQFCIEFDLENIFKTQKYIPMDLVRSIDIELTTEYNNRVIVREHTDIGYGVGNYILKNENTPFYQTGAGAKARKKTNLKDARIVYDQTVWTTNKKVSTEIVDFKYKASTGFEDVDIAHKGGILSGESTSTTTKTTTLSDIAYLENLTQTTVILDDGKFNTYVKPDDVWEYLNDANGYYGKEIDRGYKIVDYYLTADFYQFNDSYRATLEQALMSTGIVLPMESFLNVSEVLPASSRHEIRVRRSLTSVKSVYMCFELPSIVRDGRYNYSTGKYKYFTDCLALFQRFGLKSYQVLLNGVPVQGHQIQCQYGQARDGSETPMNNAEHILETMKAFSTHGNHVVTGMDLASDKYSLINHTFEPYSTNIFHQHNFVTANSGTDVEIKSSAAKLSDLDNNYTTINQLIAIQKSGDYVSDGKYHTTDMSEMSGINKQHFIIAVNLEKSTQVSGSSMQEIVTLLDWEDTTPEGLMVHTFLHYDQHLEIRPGFDFVIHE